MKKDRFKNLSKNYAKYFDEVFTQQGFSYGDLQKSMFSAVKSNFKLYKKASILDIGCGDGESLAPFVTGGCINLTGVDLNEEMLNSSKKRFGTKVKLIKADATNLQIFKPNQFDIIITGACIHNIPKNQRKLFYCELLRLKPILFIAAEKIADPDPSKHKRYYTQEIDAIVRVYKDKYKLNSVSKEWVDHYRLDEKEKLTLDEIHKELSKFYDITVVLEMGMYKTLLAIRK